MSSTSGSAVSIEISLEQLRMKIENLEDHVTTQSQEIEALRERIPNTNLINSTLHEMLGISWTWAWSSAN